LGGEPDYRTVEKTPITFWLGRAKSVTLSLRDATGKELWKMPLAGQRGFNQYRWDLVFSKQTSDYPYFVHYERFLRAGTYQMVLSDGAHELQRPLVVVEGVSPYRVER
jgi:hypothetical protein